ncbi:hypothetical protein [Actinoallomurus sp. NPDC050550]|uniref:hypothetical protein n=1 Tax=Actinoallomurus sp. NPDC050550 TaxID=3154937 RepID=UPI0033F027EB
MAEQRSHANNGRRRIRLGVVSMASVAALAATAPAYASTGRPNTSSPGNHASATDIGANAKRHVTTLWLHDTSARVWKTWSRYHGKGGGYQGQFGAYRISKYVSVWAEIHWNSGKTQDVRVKVGSKHTYRGAKSVYLRLCGDYECSAWW